MLTLISLTSESLFPADSQIPLSTIELLAFEYDSALAALSNMFILDIISWLILTPQRLLPAERLP